MLKQSHMEKKEPHMTDDANSLGTIKIPAGMSLSHTDNFPFLVYICISIGLVLRGGGGGGKILKKH
jgi:hypothetical protein